MMLIMGCGINWIVFHGYIWIINWLLDERIQLHIAFGEKVLVLPLDAH